MEEKKINFCDKCNKVVPDKEIFQFVIHGKAQGKKLHRYTEMRNYYRHQSPGKVGFDPVSEVIWCGEVREPTAEECFAYELIK